MKTIMIFNAVAEIKFQNLPKNKFAPAALFEQP